MSSVPPKFLGRFIITIYDEGGQPFKLKDFGTLDEYDFPDLVTRMFAWAEGVVQQRWTESYSVDEVCKVRQSLVANITITRKV